ELGAILPQVDPRTPRGHLPDPGDERPEARRGQHARRRRPAAERGAAPGDGVLLRSVSPRIARRDVLRGAAAAAALAACGAREAPGRGSTVAAPAADPAPRPTRPAKALL